MTKDSLLDKTLIRHLTLLLGSSVHFPVKSSFRKNPAKSVSLEHSQPQYLIRILGLLHLQVMFDCPALSSAGIPLDGFLARGKMSFPPLMFPLTFLSADYHIGYKPPLACAIFRVEPNLPPIIKSHCMVPTLILTVLNKVCLTIFNKCH